MEDIRLIAEKTKKALLDAGAQKAQLTVSETETHEFNVDGGEFSLFRTLFDRGLAITAYKDNKKGSIAVNRLDDDSIRNAARDCIMSAALPTRPLISPPNRKTRFSAPAPTSRISICSLSAPGS